MAKIKKGDKVIIITGKDKNKTGVVEKVFPTSKRLAVSGINMIKKHMKKSKKFPQGGIIELNAPIHISNVMLLDPAQGKPSRVGFVIKNDDKLRFSKLSGETIK